MERLDGADPLRGLRRTLPGLVEGQAQPPPRRSQQGGRDPDIGPGALAFTRGIAARRTSPAGTWFLRRQGWLFFPLLTLEGLNLHQAGLRHVMADRTAPHRRLEVALVSTRLAAYVVALALLLPWGMAVAFFFVQMAVFGLCLGGPSRRATKACRSCPGT